MSNYNQVDQNLFVKNYEPTRKNEPLIIKPILFSTPMVEAILEGRKTQTRRIIKPQPVINERGLIDYNFKRHKANNVKLNQLNEPLFGILDEAKYQPGNILWVRETWQKTTWLHPSDESFGFIYKASENGKEWEANDEAWKWRPSIFMPKAACRLFLEVTNVRAERLKDISDDDCFSEGIKLIEREKPYTYGYELYGNHSITDILGRKAIVGTEYESYATLWQHINGNWHANPFVWVYTFKVVGRPEGF